MTEHARETDRLVRALAGHVRRRKNMGIRRLGPGPPVQSENPSRPVPPSKVAGHKAPLPVSGNHPGQKAPPHPGPKTAGAAPLAPADHARECLTLEHLREVVAGCQACGLHATRTQTVFLDGQAQPGGVFFIGEAPGAQEDRVGTPFVGPAGQLLTDIIEKGMGLRRDQVTIANVLKCRPPANRDPSKAEKACCTPYLDRQIELINPAVLVPLGTHAAQHILGTERPISQLRGQVHQAHGRKVIPTYHPAYLLRNPSAKRDCWQDIQAVMREAGIPAPGRRE